MRTFTLITLTMLLSACLVGCEGDESVVESIVRTDETETLVMGTAIARPWTDFHLNMTKLYNEEIDIDSVKFADSLCRIGYNTFRVWGDDRSLGAYYYAPREPARFESGDTATVEIFNDICIAVADIKLLSQPDDSVILVESESDDSVAVGEPVNLVWRSIPNADWYAVDYGFWYYEGGHSYPVYGGSIATQDTTAQLPGGTRDGGYGMNIGAFTGPVPGVDGYNVQGHGLVGYIYSPSGATYNQVIVGAHESVAGQPDDDILFPAPEGSLLDNVLKAYRK
jgi:hypothetical protein